ncbi:MAG: hypothetical protein JO297_17895 [Nitrososphaeraceae archaeon]|nr:hypothetical protein [Nitrososphaeraceae archaeon]
MIISFPFGLKPPRTALIALALGTVPRIILAPPILASSSAAFCDWLST